MDRSHQFSLTADAERLLKQLTVQQHLHPAWSVLRVVERVVEDARLDGFAGKRAITEAGVDSHQAVGRLSRAQITTLAMRMESMRKTGPRLVDAA